MGLGRGGKKKKEKEKEKVVCGFQSRQLGEREQHNSAGTDEMDEIQAGVQAELNRGGRRVGQGGRVRFKSPEGRCIDLEMSPSKSAYPLSD